NPDDVRAQEALKFIVQSRGLAAKIFISTPSDFSRAVGQYRTLRGEVKAALKELEIELEEKKPPAPRIGIKSAAEAAGEITEEAPIIKMVAVMLKHAVEGRASDIHIEPERDRLRVRFRVDGILYNSLFLPIHVHPAVISRIKILSNLKIDETRVPQDGRFHAKIEEREIDFRISTFPTQNGEKVALRILDSSVGIKTVDDLGLEQRNRNFLENALKKPFGMILITGPTGSGKTTTLYAALQILNKEGVNIVSLEDPVEYFINGLNQSQVRPEIGYDFAQGLRHILRQDPDIIMVGEIRDSETAALAVHAALTGHIVLSTLHTNNVIGVIPRLLDMKIEPFLIPSSLNLAVAQRLLRRLCDDCKKEVEAIGEGVKLIEEELAKIPKEVREKLPWKPPYKIYEPVGC
ncbi:MAG: GspE/PulE family protein, partial [bacterium]|nr:GspE/PulE family protein [bacterium]